MAETEFMSLNVGPHHPSTHGVLRIVCELDGEYVRKATLHIGYLHSGFEKLCEHKTYHQIITITDRIDYMAAMMNNFAYVLAVEKLLDIEVPKRGQYIRVIMAEMSRIASHLFWLGAHGHDLGAFTPFFYAIREREDLFDLFEMATGGRLTPSYFRVGGLAADLPDGFVEKALEFTKIFPSRVDEYEGLLTKNIIYMERTKGVGIIPVDDLISWGVTGPILRASGVAHDLRKIQPYSSYREFDFDIPTGTNGDVWDRYQVRIKEMHQSNRIVRQALENLPSGPINADAPQVKIPSKAATLENIEALIHHFLITAEGFRPPVGEVYHAIESPRGELGFYIVSNGENRPYRCRIRPPTFVNLEPVAQMVEGRLLADLVSVLSSIDIVLAEVDR
ncbi:MAG: NADH dehydrogenase (quinone) subunit D [Deltaproteobacteria bacterium]|nr:NADH dehydrogenase (quinone) subunit D [Deltaproteobacteria bacterium]MBW2308634.1 NADH dehydrogenase (quinone) subunit D [Deltaproteobacteria bacterium]